MNVKNARIVVLPRFSAGRDGTIAVAEEFNHIPFLIKRVFYIYDICNYEAVRGNHANKELEEVFICVRGSCEIELTDGTDKQTIRLDEPHIGIYLGNKLWVKFTSFSPDCLLLILASRLYEESDCIRDYDEFLKYTKIANPKARLIS